MRKGRCVLLSLCISVLALLATFYQLYLQRIHNEKSLKPLGQVDLGDQKKRLYIHIQNNGLGPMMIDKLTFTKQGYHYSAISDCLNLDPKSYWHILLSDTVKKVILPNTHLVVFEKNIENYSQEEIEPIRKQLSLISLKVDYRDIYDNTFTLERNLEWFARHKTDRENQHSAQFQG
jgi:hypothetical protein